MGIGEDAGDVDAVMTDCVRSRQAAEIVCRAMKAEAVDISSDVGSGLDAQGQKFAVVVEREADARNIIARMVIRDEGLAAFANPFDWSLSPLCRPKHQTKLGKGAGLQAESATNVGRHHPQTARRHMEDAPRQFVADDMRRLQATEQGVAILSGIVASNRCASLHRVGDDAADPKRLVDDVFCFREDKVDSLLIAQLKHKANVVGRLIPDRRLAGRYC